MDNVLVNCSVFEYSLLNVSEHLRTEFLFDSERLAAKRAAGFGTLTGILLIFLVNVVLSCEYDKLGASVVKFRSHKLFNAKTASRILVSLILVLVLPLITVCLALAFLYKTLCSIIIRNKDNKYVSFLDSFDVFWSLEDDATKSIINVVGIIESNKPEDLVDNIKSKLNHIYPNENTKKIFYRRYDEYGFYYWRKYSSIDLDQYVQLVEIPQKSDKLGVTDLENLMTDLSQESLPYNDEGLFKIMITKQRIGGHEEVSGDYGIIFRIHHSVGDGIALIEFLCKIFADENLNKPVSMFVLPETYARNRNTPKNLMDMIEKLCQIPMCVVDGVLRKPDENALHGPCLSGKKFFRWTESDENLFQKVKEIKNNVEHLNFSDVLLLALSNGIRYFCTKTMSHIPEDVAVILPFRKNTLLAIDEELKLENNISVAILDLPVDEHEDFKKIKGRCDGMRRSCEPLTNYYLLKLVTNIFPKQVLFPLLYSHQATMVFSNMPGPETLTICGGSKVKSLVFFVPNKGTTGLGVTALCYGGVLRLAAVVDAALVSNPDHLDLVLEGMVDEITALHQRYVTN